MTLKNKIILSLVVFLVSGILLILFLLLPTYSEIQENTQELILQKQELALLENKIKNIEEFKKNYKDTEKNLEKARKLFINSKAPVEFISFLEENSQKCNINIEISPSSLKHKKEEKWGFIEFRIASTGAFPDLYRFIEKLETSPYLIKFININIKRLTEKDLKSKEFEGLLPGDVQANLSINVFAQ